MRTIQRDIVAAVIVSKDEKILQGLGVPDGVYPGCWRIPGGGIETGESREEALIREVLEETGIDIASYSLELVDDSETGVSEKTLRETIEKVLCEMHFIDYRVIIPYNAENIPLKPADDIIECRWVVPEDLKKIPLTPPSEKLFRKLGYIK